MYTRLLNKVQEVQYKFIKALYIIKIIFSLERMSHHTEDAVASVERVCSCFTSPILPNKKVRLSLDSLIFV